MEEIRESGLVEVRPWESSPPTLPRKKADWSAGAVIMSVRAPHCVSFSFVHSTKSSISGVVDCASDAVGPRRSSSIVAAREGWW
jgi:hypothetical protein